MKINYVNSRCAIILLSLFGFFFSNNLFAQYCSPANVQSSNINYISRVRLANIDNRSTGTTGAYADYSTSSTITNIKVGETIEGKINITMNGYNTNTNILVVWMNFNESSDDDFEDNGERFLFPITDSNNVSGTKVVTTSFSIPVPATADLGVTRMRIGFRSGNSTNFTSCNYSYSAGEVEDYKINFTTEASSVADPVTGDYEGSYCTPTQIGSSNTNYISKVTIGSINNTTSGSTGLYTDYTSTLSTDVTIAETITGSVSVTVNGNNVNTNQVIVWMNFNENDHENFDEDTERFVFNVLDNNNTGFNTPKTIIVPISIPVPSTAEVGLSRMRIAFRQANSNSYTACFFNYAAGEIEDYKINIVSEIEDNDKDGIEDSVDLDDDNDGILDTEENNILNYGSSANIPTTANGNLDSDGDGIPNMFDLDSDNDGILDAEEAGHGKPHTNGVVNGNVGTDGIPDAVQDSANNGAINYVVKESTDDADSLPNYLDLDSDGDGIPDNVEAQTTLGYIAPSGSVNEFGVDTNYTSGLNPINTDGEDNEDYLDLDSDNEGDSDTVEAGLTLSGNDADFDGLDDNVDTTTDYTDVNGTINNPSLLPDTDGDLNTGGDVDFRDAISPPAPPVITAPSEAMLYFDGVDDYLDSSSFVTNWTEATIMGWIKIESDNDGNLPSNYGLFGQETIKMYITKSRTPAFLVFTQKQITSGSNYPSSNIQVQPSSSKNVKMVNDRWYHVAGVFNSSTNTLKLYLNGELVNTTTNSNLDSELLTKNFNGTAHIYSTRGFAIGRYPTNTSTAGFDYFRGNMDEVRVFNKALTEDQLRQMVYQEIENNSGNVKGKILPKDIQDFSTLQKVPWNNLQAYYTMDDIMNNTLADYSSFGNDLEMHNITNIEEQTTPLPYVSQADGDWSNNSIWLHGNVWDVSEIQNKDWAIVNIKHDVTTSISHTSLGLIIDADKTLTVEGDNLIKNTWYLELNGTLDLKDDSQLIQTVNSDLVTSSEGKLLRRQEGTSNKYRYNYWSSPIGTKSATILTDNNTASNNSNNTPFKLNMIKDEIGANLQFTSAYDQVGKISTAWLYTYKNGVTYWDWASLATSASLNPGVGYSQKGTGNAGLQQQYLFEGKPNNGTILVSVTDKGGAGSVSAVSKTEYLLGNPYASALDIHKFIEDNEGIIDGSLLIWQQWAGNSHYLDQYQGGYAQVNKFASVRASQFVGIEGASTGNQEGTEIPSRYLPIGQAFMTEIVASGNVVFNNSQRVFIKEADADGTYNNGSTFLKSTSSKSKSTTETETETIETEQTSDMKKIRLEFNSIVGPKMRREIVLGFSETTSDAYDYGYDSQCFDDNTNDLNLNFEGKNMNMQAYGAITSDKIVSLNFKSSANNTFEISATEFENMDENQEIYLKDNTTDTYFDLRKNTAYSFTSAQGKFNTRFEIVFQSKQQSLSTEESTFTENFIYFQNTTNTLYGKKINTSIDKLAIVNMRGQIVQEFSNVSQETLNSGLKLVNLSAGAYVAWFRAQTGEVFTKKIIVN